MSTALDRNTERLTRGSILRALLTLSFPIVLANLIHTCHQLVNTFWVGRLGAEAVAAVSASFPIIFLMLSLGVGFSIAGSILIAQYAGARNQAMVNHVAAQTLLLNMIVAFAFAIIGYATSPWLLRWMGIGDDIFAESLHYLRVSFLSLPFVFIFTMFQSILRGVGEVKAPLHLVTLSVFINLALDPLFIFGWGPVPAGGVSGAAYATLVAQGLVALISLHLLFSDRFGIQLRRADFPPDRTLIKHMLHLGVPSSIEQSTQALGITAMTALVSHFGTIAIAAYGMGFRFFTFVLIPAYGISMATSTLVGQSLGAGDIQRANATARSCSRIGFWVLACMTVLLIASAVPLVRVFIPNDPELQAMGADAVRIMALSFAPIGLQMGLIGAFRGAGNTLVPLIATSVNIWILQIPLAWVLSTHTALGTHGLWLSYSLASIATTAYLAFRFRYGNWQNTRLTSAARQSTTQIPVGEIHR